MGHWVQELFGTHSSFTPRMAEQKCVYGHVWGDPVPPNCRVLRAGGHFTVARTLYYPSCITYIMSHSPPGPRATWYIKHLYTHYDRTEMRIWPSSGWPCPPKLLRPWGGWSFYGSQDPLLPILRVTDPRDQGLFGTYSTFTPKIAQQKCAYCQVSGDCVPKLPRP